MGAGESAAGLRQRRHTRRLHEGLPEFSIYRDRDQHFQPLRQVPSDVAAYGSAAARSRSEPPYPEERDMATHLGATAYGASAAPQGSGTRSLAGYAWEEEIAGRTLTRFSEPPPPPPPPPWHPLSGGCWSTGAASSSRPPPPSLWSVEREPPPVLAHSPSPTAPCKPVSMASAFSAIAASAGTGGCGGGIGSGGFSGGGFGGCDGYIGSGLGGGSLGGEAGGGEVGSGGLYASAYGLGAYAGGNAPHLARSSGLSPPSLLAPSIGWESSGMLGLHAGVHVAQYGDVSVGYSTPSRATASNSSPQPFDSFTAQSVSGRFGPQWTAISECWGNVGHGASGNAIVAASGQCCRNSGVQSLACNGVWGSPYGAQTPLSTSAALGFEDLRDTVHPDELAALSARVTSVMQRCHAALSHHGELAERPAGDGLFGRSIPEAEYDLLRLGSTWARLQRELEDARTSSPEASPKKAARLVGTCAQLQRELEETRAAILGSVAPSMRKEHGRSRREHQEHGRRQHSGGRGISVRQLAVGGGTRGSSVPPASRMVSGSTAVRPLGAAAAGGQTLTLDVVDQPRHLHQQILPYHEHQEPMHPHRGLHQQMHPHHGHHQSMHPHHGYNKPMHLHHGVQEPTHPHYGFHQSMHPHHGFRQLMHPLEGHHLPEVPPSLVVPPSLPSPPSLEAPEASKAPEAAARASSVVARILAAAAGSNRADCTAAILEAAAMANDVAPDVARAASSRKGVSRLSTASASDESSPVHEVWPIAAEVNAEEAAEATELAFASKSRRLSDGEPDVAPRSARTSILSLPSTMFPLAPAPLAVAPGAGLAMEKEAVDLDWQVEMHCSALEAQLNRVGQERAARASADAQASSSALERLMAAQAFSIGATANN